MTKIAIEINENLFIAYVGLTASGYELADKKDSELHDLIAGIRLIDFSEEIAYYFSLARTNQYPINPYWPLGSCICSACFFINEKYEYDTFGDYLTFQKSLGNNKEIYSPDFRDWIIKLPSLLKEIKRNELYPALWIEYQNIIASCINKYKTVLRKTDKCIANFTGNSEDNVHIVFVPNLLQANSIADFIFKNYTLYVVSVHPITSTLLHEYLHLTIKKYKNIFKKFINKADLNIFADVQKMSSYGYMWDNSNEAKIHTLEESIVRALSIILSNDVPSKEQIQCRSAFDNGFLLVPNIVKYSKKHYPKRSNLTQFLAGSLNYHLQEIKELK